MEDEVVATPRRVELNMDIIIAWPPSSSFNKIFPSNSSLVKKTLPNSLFHLASIPFSEVKAKLFLSTKVVHNVIPPRRCQILEYMLRETEFILLKPHGTSEKLSKNSYEYNGYNGVNDANCKVPSSPHILAIPKPMCNGLGNVKDTHETHSSWR